MRWLAVLLVLLLLVACARDPGPEPEVVVPTAELVLVLDLYDVKDLTIPIQSFPGRSGLETYDPGEVEGGPFDGEALADLIRETVDAEVWAEGATVMFREGGVLVVKAPAATQAKIGHLLAGLRKAVEPR